MKVSLVFKDVAYESLVDEAFLNVAWDAMPEMKSMHREYDVAEAEGQERNG